MHPRSARAAWLLSAWSAVLAGPIAAWVFIQDCLPSIHCEPKRECLHQSIDDAFATFFSYIFLLLSGTVVLWFTRPRAGQHTIRATAVLEAALLVAFLSAVLVVVLETGMRAVVDGRTEVTVQLVGTALLAVPTSLQLRRALRAASLRP